MQHERMAAATIASPLEHLLALPLVERVDVPPRPAQFTTAPAQFAHGSLGQWLKRSLGGLDRLYLHQGLAFASIEQDLNVVVATATASGKSLVFMGAALRKMLAGQSRVLVFYTQKALGSDQLGRWQRELKHSGLSAELVAEINGDIPVAEREQILDKARVILATPDVIHAWMMPGLSSPAVQRFLRYLDLLILDEAHALEAVFGSHAALFIRRLRLARRLSRGAPGRGKADFQVVAATATLADPVAHLKGLTGLDFVAVGENDNGAPRHGLTVLHLEGADIGAPAEKLCAELVDAITDCLPSEAALIAFADSRQGVERIIRRIGKKAVLPYRSGYVPRDRRAIETLLHNKQLLGVIATSALELGIDLPQFSVGLTVGVPPNRKSLRQRIGRIGRAREGVFAVIAPRTAFAKLGGSLTEYVSGPVDDSPLYLENPFIQYQHARCMVEEGTAANATNHLDLAWPSGFADSLKLAEHGAPIPRMLEETAALGRERPHLAYKLRSMPGEPFVLRHAVTGDTIGTIDHEKAVREAYPGASYYHFTKEYRVQNWRSFGYSHEIELRPMRSIEPTHPILRSQVSLALDQDGIIDGHHLQGAHGSLSEVHLLLAESVEGYRHGSTSLLYRELSERDRRLTRKSRRFPTTGVLVRIEEPWFSGDGEHAVATRRSVAEAVQAMLVAGHAISARDLRSTHLGIALATATGVHRLNDAVVICDSVVGGLGLTAPVFMHFPAMLDRLQRAADLAGPNALLPAHTVERLRLWHSQLEQAGPAETAAVPLHPGEVQIFAPGSTVAVSIRGALEERRIIAPALIATGAGDQLMYQYESGPGVTAWIAQDQVEPIGDQWSLAAWNPCSGQVRQLAI